MSGKHDLRVQKTLAAIESAFFTLLERKNAYNVTVTDITQTALIGRSTFYKHYLDMPDLIERIVGIYVKKFVRPTWDYNRLIEPVGAMEFYTSYFENVEKHRNKYRLLMSENGIANFYPLARQQGYDYYQGLFEYHRERLVVPINPHNLAVYVVSAHLGLMENFLNYGEGRTPQEAARELVAITCGCVLKNLGLASVCFASERQK
ncbi:MAG: TetR family transcriptional regulator C-terminal domain-containing protein [Actinomycetes bacterium]|jgi:AcrR family transcriptional regulator|nr:TetR family transcriptional regulator C-terminal domain-containing protein [Actinomycetes bacterium]